MLFTITIPHKIFGKYKEIKQDFESILIFSNFLKILSATATRLVSREATCILYVFNRSSHAHVLLDLGIEKTF